MSLHKICQQVRHGSSSPRLFVALWFCFFSALNPCTAQSQQPAQCIIIEVYYRASDHNADQAIAAAENLKASRSGITVMLREVGENPRNRERFDSVLKHFKLPADTSPVIYGCNRAIHNVATAELWSTRLKQLLQLEVFTRVGCPHCADAKRWLPSLMQTYSGLELVVRDLTSDAASRNRLSQLVQQHRTAAASVPVFHFCDSLVVGFDTPQTTGERIKGLLKIWGYDCVIKKAQNPSPPANLKPTRLTPARFNPKPFQTVQDSAGQQLESPVPELPVPESELRLSSGERSPESVDDEIRLPLLGRLSASALGMPLFTIAVGLVDGFNPCAMWVLLFLLSILVNLGDRTKILAIAGVFVVVSGLAYFAFMAAWLNVFVLIGYLRPIEISLAILAIVMGAVHIKDFFAFKRGFSLSIPESAKPGIYARVRRIVTAEHLTGAILGAITLAILVNMIELLCTAGLPALYTNILTHQNISPVGRYAYLGLYILAYMFDDALMVAVVIVTLSKRKLQESQGRWLKLISGLAILSLGIIMLVRPQWLH